MENHEKVTQQAAQEFARLVAVMDRLRSAGGCPWDAEQTHESLVRYLIEEAYEVIEAIEAPQGVNRNLLKEELGDVLLQVVFHARIAQETPGDERFTVVDVIRGLNEKMERRHPHVFAGESSDIDDVVARWDELKKLEKPERTSVFDGIPPHLPALSLAEKTLSKADKGGVELQESKQAPMLDEVSNEDELGAFLFVAVQRARAQGLDPERALRAYTRGVIAQAEGGLSASE